MDVFEGNPALPLLISNVVTIMLIVFFGRDRHQQRNAYKHQLARLEAKALIAQMNPHFIFNTLNGIQSTMVLKGKRKQIDTLEFFHLSSAKPWICPPCRKFL